MVEELIGNPSFKDKIMLEPAKFFTDEACTNCIIDEAWTADWWWKTQVSGRLHFSERILKKINSIPEKNPKGRHCSTSHPRIQQNTVNTILR